LRNRETLVEEEEEEEEKKKKKKKTTTTTTTAKKKKQAGCRGVQSSRIRGCLQSSFSKCKSKEFR
jgi:hypothetical protein